MLPIPSIPAAAVADGSDWCYHLRWNQAWDCGCCGDFLGAVYVHLTSRFSGTSRRWRSNFFVCRVFPIVA